MFLFCFIVGLVAIWIHYKKTFFVWEKRGVKQTKPWPIFGDAWVSVFQVMGITDFLNKLYRMHPGVRYTGFYQFHNPLLLIKDPELIKQIAIKDFDHFTDHRNVGVTEKSDPLFSRNLFTLKGEKWRVMRSLLSGSFTSSKMKIMHKLIAEESKKFVHHYLKSPEELIEVELKDACTRYTNDVIASTAFGIEVDSLSEPDNEFYLMGREITNFNTIWTLFKILAHLLIPKLYHFLRIPLLSKKASNFFTQIIYHNIKVREEQHIVRPDMLNLLLEVRRSGEVQENADALDSGFAVVEESQHIVKHHKKQLQLTDLDITAQAVIFFLAGFDTVSSAMSACLYELAINPEAQKKLRAEIENTECNELISYETVLNMKYLDMVVTEAIRMYPGLAAIDRLCTKSYTIEPTRPDEKPVQIKKGEYVWLPVYSIHHDPEYYPEPDKFIPERFSDENKGNIRPYTYMPFGIGPRACIGSRFALLEMKMILVYLLRKFEVVSTAKTKIPLQLSKHTLNVISKDGYHVAFKKLK